MILTLDVGNTSCKLGAYEDGKLRFCGALETSLHRTRDRCAMDILGLFRLYGAEVAAVEGAVLSCVVPPLEAAVCGALEQITGRKPLLVGPGVKTGLNIRSDLHNQLGSDIVASAVAATALYPSPVIVINSHTALSFSCMNGSSFEGCSIMPGIGIALEALSINGAQLPHISLDDVDSPLGRNTVDSMRAGIVYGYAGAIDRLIEQTEAAAGAPAATVVVTGENLPEVFRHCRHRLNYDHDLLVNGLFLIYKKNTERSRR